MLEEFFIEIVPRYTLLSVVVIHVRQTRLLNTYSPVSNDGGLDDQLATTSSNAEMVVEPEGLHWTVDALIRVLTLKWGCMVLTG